MCMEWCGPKISGDDAQDVKFREKAAKVYKKVGMVIHNGECGDGWTLV